MGGGAILLLCLFLPRAMGAAVEKLNCNSKMTLFSDQIDHEKHISDKACCNCCTAEDYPDDWRRRSISLTWANPPMYTKSYVVLMVDEEKSSQDFVHWLVTGARPSLPP